MLDRAMAHVVAKLSTQEAKLLEHCLPVAVCPDASKLLAGELSIMKLLLVWKQISSSPFLF